MRQQVGLGANHMPSHGMLVRVLWARVNAPCVCVCYVCVYARARERETGGLEGEEERESERVHTHTKVFRTNAARRMLY